MKPIRNRTLSAAIGLLAFGLLSGTAAQACSLAAWDANPTGAPVAGEPDDNPAIKKYSGRCGLAPATAPSFVQESTNHAAEGNATPYRGRFFMFTAPTAGTPTVFRALAGEGTGNSVVEIDYDAVDQNFDFRVNGAAAGSTAAGSAPRNRWIGVQFVYQAGQTFSAATRASSTYTNLTTSATGTAGQFIESVQFGLIAANGVVGQIYLDEYEGSRAATSATPEAAFTMRPRADGNGDGVCNVNDLTATVGEITLDLIGTGALAGGQTDCDENGTVNVNDLSCQVTDIVQAIFGTACTN